MEKNKRQSNFELMRIISMFMIVLWHVIIHGKFLDNTTSTINLVLNFVLCICVVHVNSFILVSGYFQYDKKFSLKKFINLFCLQWFYKISIIIIFVLLGLATFSGIGIGEIFPIGSINNYWFINCYLVLYLISPFLNKFISSIDQKTFRRCLFVCFLLFSFIAYFTNNTTVVNPGNTITHFAFLYLIGAYLHKYPLNDNYHFKNFSKEKYQIILFVLLVCITLFNFLLLSFSSYIRPFNSRILNYISSIIYEQRLGYSNPLVILQSILYFCLFESFTVKNKFINIISSTVLGIYMIHDNTFIRSIIYRLMRFDTGTFIYSNRYLIYMFIVSIIIFIGCFIIEFIRKNICKYISKFTFCKKISNKFYGYISSI